MKIRYDETFGCYEWTGHVDNDGYGIEWRGRVPVKAYLLEWERTHGPIPSGKVLDHRCRNRLCVRHLELVDQSENLKRRSWAKRVSRSHCLNGCGRETAMVTPFGGRLCRKCDK